MVIYQQKDKKQDITLNAKTAAKKYTELKRNITMLSIIFVATNAKRYINITKYMKIENVKFAAKILMLPRGHHNDFAPLYAKESGNLLR